MLGYLSLDIVGSSKLSILSEKCSLLGTDTVCGQISGHVFAQNKFIYEEVRPFVSSLPGFAAFLGS